MFASIKSICNLMDKRIQMLEENKKSIASKEEIEKANEYIKNNIKAGLVLLKRVSTNKKLIEKYEKKIKKIN